MFRFTFASPRQRAGCHSVEYINTGYSARSSRFQAPANPQFHVLVVIRSLDEVCSSFDCPDNYSSVDDADKIVCEDSGCTKKLCCDKDGESVVE